MVTTGEGPQHAGGEARDAAEPCSMWNSTHVGRGAAGPPGALRAPARCVPLLRLGKRDGAAQNHTGTQRPGPGPSPPPAPDTRKDVACLPLSVQGVVKIH